MHKHFLNAQTFKNHVVAYTARTSSRRTMCDHVTLGLSESSAAVLLDAKGAVEKVVVERRDNGRGRASLPYPCCWLRDPVVEVGDPKAMVR